MNRRALAAEPLPYDERLSAAISREAYAAYSKNAGHTYYLYLNALVAMLKPKKVLELGTDIGRSAAFMMTALPENGRLITVEIGTHERTDLIPWKDDPRLIIIQGDDLDLSIYKGIDLEGVDLLFIDAEHTYDHVSREWNLYRRFLNPGAVVALDDIHLNPGMERFWRELSCPKAVAGDGVHFSGFGICAPFGSSLGA